MNIIHSFTKVYLFSIEVTCSRDAIGEKRQFLMFRVKVWEKISH